MTCHVEKQYVLKRQTYVLQPHAARLKANRNNRDATKPNEKLWLLWLGLNENSLAKFSELKLLHFRLCRFGQHAAQRIMIALPVCHVSNARFPISIQSYSAMDAKFFARRIVAFVFGIWKHSSLQGRIKSSL